MGKWLMRVLRATGHRVNEGPKGTTLPRQTEVECGIMVCTAALYIVSGWELSIGNDAKNLRRLVAFTIGADKDKRRDEAWRKYRELRERILKRKAAARSENLEWAEAVAVPERSPKRLRVDGAPASPRPASRA